MPFRFKLGEPFDEGFKRIALEQMDRALGQVREGGTDAGAVHETRKALKRLRALLRLFRPGIGEQAFHAENAHLRDIGRSLSGARDRHVLLETAERLAADASDAEREHIAALRHAILAANGDAAPAKAKPTIARLAEAKRRLAQLELPPGGYGIVAGGLEKSYRRARRAFRHAYEAPSDEIFHEWRKGAQNHWRQMALLSHAWPDYLGARAKEARELSQLLGDDHDLALLVGFLPSQTEALGPGAPGIIEGAARRRQAALRALARPRGERLFAERPGRLRRSVGAFWSAATSLKAVCEPAAAPPAVAGSPRHGAPRRRPVKSAKA